MTFSGIPIWLTFIIATGAVTTLVGLHFLHRNFSRVFVPTLIFWQTVSQNSLYNRLWKRFRQLLTFIFLAIILLLLVFSMTRPFLVNRIPVQYVIALDCRASMRIVDKGFKQSRLDRAKDICEELLKDSSDFDKIMLITTSHTTNVIKGFADNKALGLYALKNIKASEQLAGDILQSIELAQATITGNSQIVVFTDHISELENLPAKTKKHLSVFDVAKPIFNAAILQSKVLPSDNNQSQLNITIGFWGQSNMAGTIELYENNILQQKQNISLTPDAIEQYTFAISNAAAKHFSAKLVCDDEFKNDNNIAISQDTKCKIYIDQNIPNPLKSFIDADGLFRHVNSNAEADISIYIIGNGEPLVSIAKIVPTAQLYHDKNKRDSISNELYAIGGSSLSNLPQNTVPLLTTKDGHILAAAHRINHTTSIYLADSLFTDQSTFWKQPQFPELMQKLLEDGNDTDSTSVKSETTQAVYADLWNIGTIDNSQIPPELQKKQVPLYKYIIIAALLFLFFEIYAFYKGVIV